MTLPRSARWAACFTLLLGLLSATAPAADPVQATAPPKWDPVRTTDPEDLTELKALQAAVKSVVDKCAPATVAVLYPPPPRREGSAGSGVIVSEDGLVLTAAHVIRDYEEPKRRGGFEDVLPQPYTSGKAVKLMMPDGNLVKGKTLGINADMDTGMIQITDKGPNDGKWPFVPIAKSADLKKGQWLVTLGHPNGPKEGRAPVARLGRLLEKRKDVLRTDCTLVGGDSGGPLFDLEGRVVGIHSRIGYSLASNFHVPTDQYKNEWDKLVAGEWVDQPAAAKKTTHAYIGVVFPEDEEEDAWLKEVVEGDPADKAGLKAGDTITKFNDKLVKSVREFRKLMDAAKPGDKVKLGVRRGITTLTIPMTLGTK
jgi:serine protease Do